MSNSQLSMAKKMAEVFCGKIDEINKFINQIFTHGASVIKVEKINKGMINEGVYYVSIISNGKLIDLCAKYSTSDVEVIFYKNYAEKLMLDGFGISPKCYGIKCINKDLNLLILDFISWEPLSSLGKIDAIRLGSNLANLSLLRPIERPRNYDLEITLDLINNALANQPQNCDKGIMNLLIARLGEINSIYFELPKFWAHNDVKLGHLHKSPSREEAVFLVDWGYFYPNILGSEFWALLIECRDNPIFHSNVEACILKYIEVLSSKGINISINIVLYSSYYFAAYQFLSFYCSNNNDVMYRYALDSIVSLVNHIDRVSVI